MRHFGYRGGWMACQSRRASGLEDDPKLVTCPRCLAFINPPEGKKYCRTCWTPNLLTDFDKDRKQSDGLTSKCRACRAKHQARTFADEAARDRRRESQRRTDSKPDRKRKHNEHSIRYMERHPEKTRARYLVRLAVSRGQLAAEPCWECGNTPTEAHHEDYSKPLDIRWLCVPCHEQADKRRRAREKAQRDAAAAPSMKSSFSDQGTSKSEDR